MHKPSWFLDLLISWCMAHVEINNILHLKWAINVDKYKPKGNGRRKDFFPGGGTRGFFQIFSKGGQKLWNLFFPTWNNENTFFCWIFQLPGCPWPPSLHPPTTMPKGLRGRNMVNIHNPLTALLGCDKLSSDCWSRLNKFF